jgi:hypothetical protein
MAVEETERTIGGLVHVPAAAALRLFEGPDGAAT